MKKILFAVTVFVYTLLIAISGNAQKINVPADVKRSFNDHFKNVQFVRWTPILNSYIATFTEGEGYRDAYFTDEGEFKGIGHHITADVLPMHVQSKLNNRYKGFGITEVYQFDCEEEGICFFAVLNNQKTELILKLNTYGDITYAKKSRMKGNAATEPLIASKEASETSKEKN